MRNAWVAVVVFALTLAGVGLAHNWMSVYLFDQWDGKFGRNGSFVFYAMLVGMLTLGSTLTFAGIALLGRRSLAAQSPRYSAMSAGLCAVLAYLLFSSGTVGWIGEALYPILPDLLLNSAVMAVLPGIVAGALHLVIRRDGPTSGPGQPSNVSFKLL